MFGTHLVGPSLMLNAAMRWPAMVPAAFAVIVVTSVVQPTAEDVPRLALAPAAVRAAGGDAKPSGPLASAYAAVPDRGEPAIELTQVMGAGPAADAPPALTTQPLEAPPRPAGIPVRELLPLPVQQEPIRETVVAIEAGRSEPPSTVPAAALPYEDERAAAVPSATDSDSDESPGVRLLLAAP